MFAAGLCHVVGVKWGEAGSIRVGENDIEAELSQSCLGRLRTSSGRRAKTGRSPAGPCVIGRRADQDAPTRAAFQASTIHPNSTMADKVTNITELPLDILVLVLPYLDAKSFLAFCSTCKAFQQPSIRLDPAYWSHATRSTFRVPNQPVVQHDGPRWQNMYRRMLHQSRVFTWGSNQHQRLGHSYAARIPRNPMIPPGFRRHRFPQKEHCSIPTEMERVQELGVIADLQCG